MALDCPKMNAMGWTIDSPQFLKTCVKNDFRGCIGIPWELIDRIDPRVSDSIS